LAESQLRDEASWLSAHPHLLRLWEWGGASWTGPYLYAVMEYADQTLAQLLRHRALTDDEAREMLLPTLTHWGSARRHLGALNRESFSLLEIS
jgi:hypothetical protein